MRIKNNGQPFRICLEEKPCASVFHDFAAFARIPSCHRRIGGRCQLRFQGARLRPVKREESPDTTGRDSLRKRGRRGSRRDDGKCHREYTAARTPVREVRVKRWGKSPPRRQQCRRHGKPTPVQGQISERTARPMLTGVLHRHIGGGVAKAARGMKVTGESARIHRHKIRLTAPWDP